MTTVEPTRGFPVEEFERRTARAQAMMVEAGLGVLLLTTEPEVRYFTGYLTQFWQSPTRPWFVVVPAAGKPVAVIPTIGVECMRRTWIEDIRTWSSPYPADEGISLLASTLVELVGHTARIGVPMGPETHVRMPMNDYARLGEIVDRMHFIDATSIIRGLRMVKSAAEIEKISNVCTMVSDVFGTWPDTLHVGMTEIEIFRSFKIACLERGVDDVAYLVGGAGPGGYRDIISPPSTRSVERGDVLILDTGAVFDGYFCDFDRNWAFGMAGPAVADAYELVYEATEAGFTAAQPGACCADVFNAMQSVMEKAGALGNNVGRLGHGLGMQLTESPSNTASDRTELVPGMVLTLEPGMTFAAGRLMVHEENIVIEENGPRYLTRRASPTLPVIDA